jgi:hypothetical protein
MQAWKGGNTDFGDVLGDAGAFSMDDGDWPDVGSGPTDFAAAAPVVVVAQEKKKKEAVAEAPAAVDPADPAKGEKKAKTTLGKWGWEGPDVETALAATAEATAGAAAEGQTAFNKARQVAALDWLLLNAPEERVPVDYRNDAAKARS